AGIICYHGVNLKMRLGYDDSLDVVGIHGFGGAWGAIATGIFASSSVNPAGADGLIFGNGKLLLIQIVSVLATVVFAFIASFLLLKAIDAIWGLRVDDEQEVTGLDLSLHGERGYEF
nr:ammonia channel protein [Deltaproteobacteria bacterium]